MAPLLPLLLAAGAGLFFLSRQSDARVVELDDNMPAALRHEVQQEMLHDKNAANLEVMALELAPQYPKASFELRYQAWILRGRQGPPPIPGSNPQMEPPPPGQLNPACAFLDKNLDAPTCNSVLNALMTGTSPDELDAFGTTMEPAHPLAAAALHAKAKILRGQAPAPPNVPPVNPAPGPIPSAQEICARYDAGMDAATCQRVADALINNADPTSLDALSREIAPKYPRAAQALQLKAAAARIALGGPVPTPQRPPPPPSFPLSDPSTILGPNMGRPVPSAMIITGTEPHNVPAANAPATIARIGSRGSHDESVLGGLNPEYDLHTTLGVSMGQAINVPWDWAGPLKAAGYDVRQDPGAGPGIAPIAPPHVGPVPMPPQNIGLAQTSGDLATATPRSHARPRGSHYVQLRQFSSQLRGPDAIQPQKLAKLGSGTPSPMALAELHRMNPHLVGPYGVIEGFHPGDQINVPDGWVASLQRRGLLVQRD